MFGTFKRSRALCVASSALLALSLSGCGMFGGSDEPSAATTVDGGAKADTMAKPAAAQKQDLDKEGCPKNVSAEECGGSYLFGKTKDADDDTRPSAGARIGVNSYLWRASLDTISFMPLISVDPFGGVIITDWYSNPNASDERFKLTVYVLDTELRADAVKVNIFKQKRSSAGWADSPADPLTAGKLEDSILTRARELRLASVTNTK